MKAGWSHGQYDSKNIKKIAEVYCATAARDVEKRNEMQKVHPGRFLQIVYDDLVNQTEETVDAVLNFLNTPLLQKTDIMQLFDEHIKTSSKGRWKKHLSVEESQTILKYCGEYMKIANMSIAEWKNKCDSFVGVIILPF